MHQIINFATRLNCLILHLAREVKSETETNSITLPGMLREKHKS